MAGAAVITASETLASNDDDTAFPTAAAVIDYVDAQVTAQDLDFAGDSGTGAVDLDSQSLTISGTANEIETSASGQTITIGLPNDVTIGNNLTVTGDLTVNGDTTTVSTINMTVEDRFISLNSGGASDVTTGIVFEGAADKVFGWDTSSGRFAMDLAGGDASATGGGFSPDGYMVAAHSGAGTPAAPDDLAIAGLEKIGNIYVDTSDNDAIYIYS